MKNCAYCGRENDDSTSRCAGCGTSEFITAGPAATVSTTEDKAIEPEVLVPDRPKFVIVAGIWAIHGQGLVGNLVVLVAVLTGAIRGILALLCFWLSLGGGALCAYLLYRVVRNYNIQKTRAVNGSFV